MQKPVSYEEAKERRYPERITIAVVKDAAGKYNPITLSWAMRTSLEPPMIAISVGKERHSLAALRHSRAFVVSQPSLEMKDDMLFFGTKSGAEMDKLAERGTAVEPASKIDGRLLSDAVANFECELVSEHETGDHVIFVGKIVAAHVNADRNVQRIFVTGEESMGAVRPV